jgi:hypothetical protein
MANPAAIYTALAAKALADAPLMALMPDGVYRDIAASGKTRFIIISKASDFRAYMFGGVAYEEVTYLVKAVEFGTSGTNAANAAARILTLLQDGTLTITGYTLMRMQLAEDGGMVEYVEPDEANLDARWQHRGWNFDITVSP